MLSRPSHCGCQFVEFISIGEDSIGVQWVVGEWVIVAGIVAGDREGHGHEPSYNDDSEDAGVLASDVEELYNKMLQRYEVPYNAETGAPDLYHLRERLLPAHRMAPEFDDPEWPILFRALKNDGERAWGARIQFKQKLSEAFENPSSLAPFRGIWAPACVSKLFLEKMQSRFGEFAFREFGFMDYVDASGVLRIDVGAGVTGGALEYVHSAMLASGITSPYQVTADEMQPIKQGLQQIARAALNQEEIPGLRNPEFSKQTWFANAMLMEIEGMEERRCVYSCNRGHVEIATTAALPGRVNCMDCGQNVRVIKFKLLENLANEPAYAERVMRAYGDAMESYA